ncbi:winged helix-turn-helix domain-containing protein [Enterococcus sp. LJL99]
MSNLGIFTSEKDLFKEFVSQFESMNNSVIQVNDKKQMEQLDGLIIHLTETDGLTETIKWLLFSKTRSELFVWIFSSKKLNREEDILFELGANDVVFSPTGTGKLFYIVKNTFARLKNKNNSKLIKPTFNENNQSFSLDGKVQQLTRTEYRLFKLLYDRIDTTVTYTELSESTWDDFEGDRFFRVANVVFHLREKMKENGRFEIKTIRSVGYMLKVK